MGNYNQHFINMNILHKNINGSSYSIKKADYNNLEKNLEFEFLTIFWLIETLFSEKLC